MKSLKKIIKLFSCRILYHTGLLRLFFKLYIRNKAEFPAVIINYHRFVKNFDNIIETHPSVSHLIDDFRKEIEFLQPYFDIVSFDTVVEALKNNKPFVRPTIAITIDDGFKDNFELLFPILKEKSVPAMIFLSTSVIGTKKRNWVDRLGDVTLDSTKESVHIIDLFGNEALPLGSIADKRLTYNRIVQKLKDVEMNTRDGCIKKIEEQLGFPKEKEPLMLNWDEVRTMSNSNVAFGAHTHTHPILTKIPLEEAKKDILDSKVTIEQELGGEVKHFAYPNGRIEDFNDDLRKYCQEIGFSSISTFDYGNNREQSDVWSLKRIGSESPISLFAVNVVRAFCKRQ